MEKQKGHSVNNLYVLLVHKKDRTHVALLTQI